MSFFSAGAWAAIGATAAMAGAGVAVVGTINQGKAAAAQHKFQAQQAEENARRAAANADAEAVANQREQALLDKNKRSILASQKTALAASGLMLSGSALDVMSDTDLAIEIEKADSRHASRLRSYGYLSQSRDFGMESAMQVSASKNSRTSSLYSAGGSLLSGAGQAAAIYAR